MKKQMLADSAAKLYVEKSMTLENIAQQLNVNERTLRRWKAADKWEEKRLEYIKSKTTFHEDLYNFGKTLLKSIKTDMTNGKKIEPSRMYTLIKIMNMLKTVKTYEDKVLDEKLKMEETKSTGLTPEVIREIQEKILGITYNE